MGSRPVTALQRTVVIGTTGCGKTTFARKLGAKLVVPIVELDALNWGPNWQAAELEVFRARVARATASERWVAEGGYHAVRDIVWGRASDIIWLDYPFPVVAFQLLRRTLGRIITQEEMWNGNRESFRMVFLDKDSILLWLLTSYWRHRREYPREFLRLEFAHLHVTHLRSRSESHHWLEGLNQNG